MLLVFFTVSLLVGLVNAAPTSAAPTSVKHAFSDKDLPQELVIYTAEYDIVNILFPLNGLNALDDDDSRNRKASTTPVIFFILADNINGKSINKGLYVRKNGEVTKLLDNAVDAAAANDGTRTGYFATSNGIYFYNDKENKAEKYGTVTDNIIGIAKLNGSDAIYILTSDHVLYKVTDGGINKDKVAEVDNANQIVLDYENNLYYTANGNVYIFGREGVKKFEGLPENRANIKLLKPPLVFSEGIPMIMDNKIYAAYSNGTSEVTDLEIETKATAISVEGSMILYVAHNKKIYEYNIMALILGHLFDRFKAFLEGFSNGSSVLSMN